MKVVVQRCHSGSVFVDNKLINKIEQGLVLLVGFTHDDNQSDIEYMVNKISKLRIFDDENGIMNKSIMDVQGEVLSISQFTLYGETKKGNRPSYIQALGGDRAKKLYEEFNEQLGNVVPLKSGVFGADMDINICNNGPVTIIIDT